MNDDVSTEILLHLPVQSLLRFRAVCNSWGNIIDSHSFQQRHTQNDNSNKSDDTVCLQVSFPNDGNRVQQKLSIKLQHNDKSVMSHASDCFTGFSFCHWFPNTPVRSVVVVKGLICINPSNPEVRVAICNPFLGQLKILPPTTSSHPNPCQIRWREVAIGFHEDYKVVQLLACWQHQRIHVQLYSTRTNSWTEFTGDSRRVLDGLHHVSFNPIKSWCKNGYFSHWLLSRYKALGAIEPEILTLDMRNEVFHTVCLPVGFVPTTSVIFAENEHSFRLFDFPFVDRSINTVGIYESICEGNVLRWNHVMNVEVPFSDYKTPLWQPGWVFFYHAAAAGAFVYDHRARKFICKHAMLPEGSRIVEYRGSFVSLKN